MCYMPTWPFFKHLPKGPNPKPQPNKLAQDVVSSNALVESGPDDDLGTPGPDDDWYHPKPRCINRLEPYGIL